MKDDYCLSNRERVLVRKERETFDWIGMSFLMRTKSAFEEEKRKIFLRRTYCYKSFMCVCGYKKNTRSGKPLSIIKAPIPLPCVPFAP